MKTLMKEKIAVLSCLFVILLSLLSCEKNLITENSSVLESNEAQKEFVIFKELQEYLFDEFDPKNEDHINLLLAEVNPTLRKKLEESYVIAKFLEENNIVNNHIEVFGEAIPAIEAIKPLLSEKQIKELNNLIAAEASSKSNCYYSCVTVGWYYCHPCYCVTCPIKKCSYYCSTNTVVLFEGNDAKQDKVAHIDVHSNKDLNFTNNSCCQNDEARSAMLFHMKAGQRIVLFDDSNPTHTYSDDKDDYMYIYIKKDFTSQPINTFESDINNNSYFSADYSCKKADHDDKPDSKCGNLDGKVSRFKARN